MTSENAIALKAHVQVIAAILYEETTPENLNTLEEIEQTVRPKGLCCKNLLRIENSLEKKLTRQLLQRFDGGREPAL